MASKKTKRKTARPAPRPEAKRARPAAKRGAVKVPAKKAAAAKAPARKTAAAKAPAGKMAGAAAPDAQVVHWEIQSQNPTKLHQFYAEAFTWKVDANNPMQYGMVGSGGPNGIDGGIGGTQAPGSRVVVYASVPSIVSTLERIESLGGKTVMPRTDIGPVIMALYEDPEGNVMGLIEG